MKKYIYTYSFLLFVLVAAGCKKDLNLTPKDKLSDASFWKTPADFQLAANDFYYGLKPAGQNTDNNSDIAFGSGANPVSNGSYLAEATSDTWDVAYKQIRATNYLLQKAAETGQGTAVDRWVGEAQFFRAYNYWNLVSKFGGVPKIETVLDVASPELYAPKASQTAIIDFILADLQSAVAKLPVQSALTADEQGRVTKGAALALMARASLYMGTWAKYHAEGDASKYITMAADAAE